MRTPFLLIFFSLLFVSATPQVTSVTADQVDVNGDGLVDSSDATLIYSYLLGSADDSVTADQVDVNGDGLVDSSDATLIYSYLLGSADDSVTADQVDVNGDGLVNTVDVVEVYKYIKENKNIEGEVTVTPWNEENIDGGEAEE